jgi:uncharacterized protein YdhG (YjbR/CyaY superfamily)
MRSMLHSAAIVDAWFDTLQPAQRETAEALRACVRTTAPELTESIKWGNLVFSLAGRHALAILVHREHANLQVFNGALLAGQFPALEGAGRGMRHLKLRYRQPVDVERVAAVVSACVAAMAS